MILSKDQGEKDGKLGTLDKHWKYDVLKEGESNPEFVGEHPPTLESKFYLASFFREFIKFTLSLDDWIAIKLKFDYIVIAFGAGYEAPIRYDINKDAELIKRKVVVEDFTKNLKNNDKTNILIVGGGYTSIELACALKHHTKKPVTLITRSNAFCKGFNTKAQELVLSYMKDKLSIDARTNTTIDQIDQS